MILVLFSLFAYAVYAQGYCQCQSGGFVNDPLQQCLTSANASVQNTCFVCPVTNATAKYYYCDSLLRRGFSGCGQPGAIAAMKAACEAIGGDTSSSDFRCLANAGTDKSQVNSCSNFTAAPTSPTGVTTTASPTSDAPNKHSTSYILFMTIGLMLVIWL